MDTYDPRTVRLISLGILVLIAVVTILMGYTRKHDPKAPGPDPFWLLLLGWSIPGAGHWWIGHRGKAVFFFLMIGLLAGAGIVLADFRNVRIEDNIFYWAGQLGCGLILLVANGPIGLVPAGRMPLDWYEIGLLYICVAGMLNVVVLFNLFNPPTHAPTSSTNASTKEAA